MHTSPAVGVLCTHPTKQIQLSSRQPSVKSDKVTEDILLKVIKTISNKLLEKVYIDIMIDMKLAFAQ